MANIVIASSSRTCDILVRAYVVMACIVIASSSRTCNILVMAYVVMAYIVIASSSRTCNTLVMAYVVMAYVVMAYIVIASSSRTSSIASNAAASPRRAADSRSLIRLARPPRRNDEILITEPAIAAWRRSSSLRCSGARYSSMVSPIRTPPSMCRSVGSRPTTASHAALALSSRLAGSSSARSGVSRSRQP